MAVAQDCSNAYSIAIVGTRAYVGLGNGCGDGRITFQYAADAAHVTAFDTDEEGILSARAALPTARSHNEVRYSLDILDLGIRG